MWPSAHIYAIAAVSSTPNATQFVLSPHPVEKWSLGTASGFRGFGGPAGDKQPRSIGRRIEERLITNAAANPKHEMGEDCLAWWIIIASWTFRGLVKTSGVSHLTVELNPATNPGP